MVTRGATIPGGVVPERPGACLRGLAAAMVLLATGCATARPILYPNAHLKTAGLEVADGDIADCQALAEGAGARGDRGKGMRVAGQTAIGAGVGAAGGVVGGAIGGNPGRGAAIGAASGATASLLYSLLGLGDGRPSDTFVAFVNQCLSERGYQVAGWD